MGQTPLDDEAFQQLAALAKKNADEAQKSVPKKADQGKPGVPSTNGFGTKSGNPKGQGTKGKVRPGDPGQGGTNGIGGSPRKMSKREVFAARWRFDFSGTPRQHAEKLAAAGVIVVVADQTGTRFAKVVDLKCRPVVQPMALPKPEYVVQWRNRSTSLKGLAYELRLPFAPPFVVLLMPQAREMTMADAEGEFAERNSRDLKTVRGTLIYFQRQNGKYEPVVLAQQ